MLKEILEKYEDIELLTMDGYDNCIIGVGESCGQHPKIVYDANKVIQQLVNEGMTIEEAEEFFSFNQLGAYMGENTPIFLFTPD